MSFSIKMRTEYFEQSRLVSGPIWLEVDGETFPDRGWPDFPVIILGWWLNAVKPLINKRATICECLFMDGPYRFEVNTRKQARWTMTFIRNDTDGKRYLMEAEVPSEDLISEMLSAARSVVNLCLEKGWESKDLTILEEEIREVSGLMVSK